MPDNDTKVERELKQLKSEIRQLRQTIIALCALIAVSTFLFLFPQLAVVLLFLTAAVLIALLISPARRMVFPYLFSNKEDDQAKFP